MKQHISVTQLLELTEEQKERLRDWWQPKEGDLILLRAIKDHEWAGGEKIKAGEFDDDIYVLYDDGEYQEYSIEDKTIWGYGISLRNAQMYPLLRIGQMIELLAGQSSNRVIEITSNWYEYPDIPLQWRVDCRKVETEAPELINALFQAVKEVL